MSLEKINMNGHKIVDLYTGDPSNSGDVVSNNIMKYHVNTKVDRIGDEIVGNLIFSTGTDIIRMLGCLDLTPGSEFELALGDNFNNIIYEKDQYVEISTEDGLVIKLDASDIIYFGIDDVVAYENVKLYKSPSEYSHYVTKNYIDNKGPGRCMTARLTGVLRDMTSTENNYTFRIYADSVYGDNPGYNVASLDDDAEWLINEDGTFVRLYIEFPMPVRIWKYAMRGRKGSSTTDIITGWMLQRRKNPWLHTEIESRSGYNLDDSKVHFFIVEDQNYEPVTDFLIVFINRIGNSGLRYLQFYVFNE